MKAIKKITPIEKDFAKWYIDVIINGNLIEYGPVKGTIIFRPNSFQIWEQIQKIINSVFSLYGIQNVYLPMLIPASLFEKEKNHLEGFAPELATITQVGNKKLAENIFIRPTSEVLFATYFKKIITSYNDLPILNNQWVNVLRWEKTTNPFLRNSEFLWQEGHTCHSSEQEALEFAQKMIDEYQKFVENYLAISLFKGQKTEMEKFSGAKITYTIEAMMKDGKALQCGTSHFLGANFSKIYQISFKDKDNLEKNVSQSSFGISTRLLGALIMNHGDNRGIIIPPRIAPICLDLVLIWTNNENYNQQIRFFANSIICAIKNRAKNSTYSNFNIRILDNAKTYGFKAAQSEIEGVPLRIEIGLKDFENHSITLVRRDTLAKEQIKIDSKTNYDFIFAKLDLIQENLFLQSKKRRVQNTFVAQDYEEFKKLIKNKKFVKIYICDDDQLELKIKEETGATSRCILDNTKVGNCIFTNQKTTRLIIFARAY